MTKFIILCTLVALCMARSLNDDVPKARVDDVVDTSEIAKPKDVSVSNDAVPQAVVNKDDIVAESDTSATVKDTVEESDLAAAIDSNSGDITDSDKTRFLFRFTTTATTTTPKPMMQSIDLLLTLNSMATG